MTQAEENAIHARLAALELSMGAKIENGFAAVFDKIDAISAREMACRVEVFQRLTALETTSGIGGRSLWWVLGAFGAAVVAALGGVATHFMGVIRK